MPAQRHKNFTKERTATTERKESERFRRADYIASIGIEMLPCNICAREKVSCIMAPGASKCSRCLQLNSRCSNAPPTAYEWSRIKEEEDRLEVECQEASKKL